MTEDGNVRILAARTTDMAREAVRLAGCGGELAQIYSNLLTGAALLELAQAPIDRIQMALEHNGTAGQLLADIWPGPIVRGRIEFAQAGGQLLGDEIRVQVTRQPARGGEPYTSIVDVADGHVANALQQYVLESEQMLTLFTLATVLNDDGEIARSGGMIVQALPGAEAVHIRAVTECLEKVSWDDLVAAGDDPILAADAIFDSIKPHHVGNDPIIYRCRCSKAAAVRAVEMLSDDELAQVRAGQSEAVTCEFCGTTYAVTGEDLTV